ncbi:hypothetical protein FRC12_006734 [Ceratobasidium sp. 428]|nr:hypothetical protein FRC12_006734 [Ceratobasidium sp. 428]
MSQQPGRTLSLGRRSMLLLAIMLRADPGELKAGVIDADALLDPLPDPALAATPMPHPPTDPNTMPHSGCLRLVRSDIALLA